MPFVPEEHRLRLVVELGNYFKRYAMDSEVKALRSYYRHLKEALNPKPKAKVPTDQLINHYASVLQLPPYDTEYEVRTGRAPCKCGAPAWRLEEKAFPDRWFLHCRDCKGEWLVLAGPNGTR